MYLSHARLGHGHTRVRMDHGAHLHVMSNAPLHYIISHSAEGLHVHCTTVLSSLTIFNLQLHTKHDYIRSLKQLFMSREGWGEVQLV